MRSLVIGGASPYAPAEEESRIGEWAASLANGDVSGFARAIGAREEYVKGVLEHNDPKALAAAQLGILDWAGVRPEEVSAPALLYAGERDPFLGAVQRAARAMPTARLEVLSGLNHMTGFGQADRVLPVVEEFLRQQG